VKRPGCVCGVELDEDENALCLVEHDRVWGGRIWDPSCIDEFRRRAVAVTEHLLSLFRGEGPIWYAAKGRCALCISVGCGETPVVVYGVLGDIGMAHEASVLRRGQRC
jgi:hypothetical protein